MPSIIDNQDKLLTPQEAADEVFRTHRSWVYRMIETNALPYYKVGKYVRLSRNACLRWLERQHRAAK
jgi:excisionase family DNA binding protein